MIRTQWSLWVPTDASTGHLFDLMGRRLSAGTDRSHLQSLMGKATSSRPARKERPPAWTYLMACHLEGGRRDAHMHGPDLPIA
jgi:hypothetical protein